MRARGRPVLGAISGALFGLGLALTLLVLGVIALNNVLVVVLPAVLLVVGILWAFVAPLGPRKPPPGWRPKDGPAGRNP